MATINPIKYVESCAAKNAPTGNGIKETKKIVDEAKKAAEKAYKEAHQPIDTAAIKEAAEVSKDIPADKYVESLRAQLGF